MVQPDVTGDVILRVVHGAPTPEELAVVTALVTAATTAGAPPESAPPCGRWADPARTLRQPLRPGPGGWRAAVL